jgi:acetyl-CoA acetyltransferase
MLGCGQPAGEAGYDLARVAAVMAGLDNVPGVTVNRYCSSSLQTIRMAAHAIRAGAVIVMSETRAPELDIKPLARIISSGVTGLNPEITGMAMIVQRL